MERNEQVKKWRAAKRDVGLCTTCPNKADLRRDGKPYSRCKRCRMKQSDSRQIEAMRLLAG